MLGVWCTTVTFVGCGGDSSGARVQGASLKLTTLSAPRGVKFRSLKTVCLPIAAAGGWLFEGEIAAAAAFSSTGEGVARRTVPRTVSAGSGAG